MLLLLGVLLLLPLPVLACADEWGRSSPSTHPALTPTTNYQVIPVVPGVSHYLGSNGSHGTIITFPSPPTYYEPPITLPPSAHYPMPWDKIIPGASTPERAREFDRLLHPYGSR